MPSKRCKRLAVVWSCLFLIQEFQVVLLLNIDEMRASTRIPDATGWSIGKGTTNGSTFRKLHKVLDALRSLGNRFKERNASIVEKVKTWLKDCESGDEKTVHNFWKDNPTFSFFYILISSVLFYIADCETKLEERAVELIDLLGSKTTIQIIKVLAELDEALHILNATEHENGNRSTQERKQEDDHVENFDVDVFPNLASSIMDLLTVNLFNTGQMHGIFNALASNYKIGNETELEHMLQYVIESAVEEIPFHETSAKDLSEKEPRQLKANDEVLKTELKYDTKQIESQKILREKKEILSALNIFKSQFSPGNESSAMTKANHTPIVSDKILRPKTLNAYQDLFEKIYMTVSSEVPMRTKRTAESVQNYIMYIISNPCFVVTSSNEHNFSVFERFSNLQEQKWRYELKHLINLKTNRAVSVNTFSGYFQHVMMLEETDWDAESQGWDISDTNRLVHVGTKNCKLDIYNGYVSVYCSDLHSLIEIEVVPDKEYKKIHWNAGCNSIDSHDFFFLKSENSTHACKVLTVTGLKDPLSYQEAYDRDISWQLWRISNNHLINKGSGLILHLTKNGLELLDLKRTTEREKSKKIHVYQGSRNITLIQNEACEPMKSSQVYDYGEEYVYKYDKNPVYDGKYVGQVSCSDDEEINMTWIYVDLDSARNNLERISCFYFFLNANSPCEILIVDEEKNNTLRLVAPEMEHIEQGAGLWYYSENHFIHAGTGLALTLKDEFICLNLTVCILTSNGVVRTRVLMDKNQLWFIEGPKLMALERKNNLTMQSQATGAYTREWFVTERSVGVVNIREGCGYQRPFYDLYEDYVNYDYGWHDAKTAQHYVIRNKANACKFLTVSEPYLPVFEYIATQRLERFVWTITKNVIMHENSRLVISFINSGRPHREFIVLKPVNPSVYGQEWVVNGTRIMSKQKESCEIGLLEENSDLIALFCNDGYSAYKEWEFIPVSERMQINDLICPFFLRNDDENCFFLTHLNRSDLVATMPIYPEVILSQLWYWDDNHIKELISGKYLSVSMGDNATLVVSDVEENSFKGWVFKQNRLSPFNDLSTRVEKQPDGTISLQKTKNENIQSWSMLFQKDIELNATILHCDNPDDEELFLIRSEKFPCVVLTSVTNNEPPIFIPFDDSIMADQLWWLKEGTLVNVGTRLHIIVSNSDFNSEVLMAQKDSSVHGITHIEFRSNSFFIQHGVYTFRLKASLNINGTIVLTAEHTGNTSMEFNFKLLKLKNLEENMDLLLCTYFIRSNLSPCQFLTGKENLGRVMVEPLLEANLENQLWFWQTHKLIHARTGLMLSTSESGRYLVLRSDTNETWVQSKHKMVQQRGLISKNTWEVDPVSEGSIKLESPTYLPNQQWTFLWTRDLLQNPEILECPYASPGQQKLYFLKNRQYPCVLLTATNESKYPIFQHLNSGSVEQQLWYQDNNNIINVESGFALRALPNRTVDLWHRNAFKIDQKWFTRGYRILSQSSTCLQFSQSMSSLQLFECRIRMMLQQWEWVSLENINNVTCFYFIRNELPPCEFLTGSTESTEVTVRPLLPDHFEKQIWYWNATRLVHYKTGRALQIINGKIVMQSSANAWNDNISEFDHYQNSILVRNDRYNALTMMPNENGLISILSYQQTRAQKWKYFEVDSSLENIDDLFCLEEDSAQTDLFFILNEDVPCHVLTARQKGQSPEFMHFSDENINNQLWYMKGEAIINSATLLALDINHALRSQVILNDRFAFVNSQKWIKDGYFIVSKHNANCVLDAIREIPRIPISYCSKHGGKNQRWLFVLFDDSFSNFEKVVCLTFIQNRRAPCELLTGFGKNEEVRTRPASQDLISSQVWFWNGDKLINANTGLALDIENKISGGKIILRDKGNFMTQKWKRDLFFIKSSANNYVLDLDVASGDVITWADPHGGQNQQWYFVNKDDGLQNADRLHCENVDSHTLYFLKSEESPCHLLTHEGDGRATRRTLDTNAASKQLWFWLGNHIINVDSGKALSCKQYWYNGAPVVLETRHAFERYQQWTLSNGQIKSLFKDQIKVLDYRADQLMLYNADDTGSQRWTWLSMEDVNNDKKSLRCAHCYDRSEEEASEIISYIPIFSTIYNTIRATVYAGKGCDEVALESLQSALIDIAFDIATVLTAGAASAAAYGIKTGIKFGVKAGIKAAASAIKASIKVSVNAAKVGIQTVLKQGFASVIQNRFKTSILSMRNILKTSFRGLKNIPIVAKTVLSQSLKKLEFGVRSIKLASVSLTTNWKRLNMLRKSQGYKKLGSYLTLSASTAGKLIAQSISNKMRAIGKLVKSKLKQTLDSLAEKAENNIKLAKTNTNGYKKFLRCKRGGVCDADSIVSQANDDAKYLKSVSDRNILKVNEDIKEDMRRMLSSNDIQIVDREQFAVVGLRNPDTREIDNVFLKSVGDIRGQDSRHPPLGKDMTPVELTSEEVKASFNFQHSEQFLLENKLNIVLLEECRKRKSPCEIFLYTKLSPCTSHRRPDALSCMDYLSKKCTELYKTYHTKCIVGFDMWWGDGQKWLDDDKVKTAFIADNAEDELKRIGLPDDASKLITKFLSSDNFQQKVMKTVQDYFKGEPAGISNFKNTYTEVSKRLNPYSDFENKNLNTLWNELAEVTAEDVRQLKKSIKDSFEEKFEAVLITSEKESVDKYMKMADDYLTASGFNPKTMYNEFTRKIDDRYLIMNLNKWKDTKLNEWKDTISNADKTKIEQELKKIIGDLCESGRKDKKSNSLKAFVTYLDSEIKESFASILREEIARKKTIDAIHKISDQNIIELFHLG